MEHNNACAIATRQAIVNSISSRIASISEQEVIIGNCIVIDVIMTTEHSHYISTFSEGCK